MSVLKKTERIRAYEDVYECGCGLENGFCKTHQPMVAALHREYSVGSVAGQAIRKLCNGYGEQGYCPDWSAVRDSTPAAIEAMYAALTKEI